MFIALFFKFCYQNFKRKSKNKLSKYNFKKLFQFFNYENKNETK